jgi:hypothetical protein
VAVTLTCVVDDNNKLVIWRKNQNTVGSVENECELSNGADPTYNYTCDVANKIYYLIIPPDVITNGIQNVAWRCIPIVGVTSNKWSLTLSGT